MRRAVVLALFLGGCATPILPTVADYQPYIPASTIRDQAALDHDKADCLKIAEALPQNLSVSDMANQGAQGASAQGGAAVITPWAMAGGAAGGVVTSLLQGIGTLPKRQIQVYDGCLRQRGQRSGAYEDDSPPQ
jgi:hypothetical protein